MAIRQIAKMGHPVLRKKAGLVDDPTDPDIARLAADMQDTLEWIGAAGIAAPQVYDSRRVVVYRGLIWERCLSLPGLHGKVPRYKRIEITYLTLEGESRQRVVEDWHAMLLQHECDHLDGILYPMRMTDLSYLAFNAEPGVLAKEAETTPDLDMALRAMVEAWPAREKWLAT